MTAKVGSLNVDLTLETARFNKGLRNAQSDLNGFQRGIGKLGGAIAGAFASVGIGQAVQSFRDAGKAALDSAGSIGEQAAALGVSTDALQEFRFAATQVGVSTEQMDTALGQFSKRLGQAELTGKGPFVNALKQIGLSLDDLKGKTETEQLAVIAQGIQSLGTEAQKSAVQVAFFGKSGQTMATFLKGGAEGIREFAAEARQLGVVLSESDIAKADETADKLAKLNYVIEAQSNKKLLENSDAIVAYEEAIGGLKLAAITSIGDLERANQRYNKWALDFNQSLRHAINGAAAFALSLPAKLASAAKGALSAVVNIGRDIVLGLARGIRNNAAAVWEALKGVITGGISRAKSLLGIKSPSRVFMEIGDYIGQGLAIGIEGSADRVAAATRRLTEAARQAAEETKELLSRLFPEIENANRYRDDLARIAGSGLSDDAKSEARFRLGQEVSGVMNDAVSVQTWDDLGLELEEAGDSGRTLLNTMLGIGEATEEVRRGWQSLKDVGASAFRELSDQLTGVILGAQSLGEALRNVIARLAEMALNQAFNVLGTALGIKIPGYASGTNFAPGGLALVGEKGPELVNLPRGSQVIPNQELASMGRGSQPITFNLYGVNGERAGREAASQIAMRLRHSLNPG